MPDLTVARDIAASPEAIWALVSDLPRMGEWSNENTGGTWHRGATGPAVGARFKGTNANGAKRWTTMAEVTDCTPSASFGFHVKVGIVNVADWHYSLSDLGNGSTRVTESWTDRRPGLARKLGATMSGVSDRKAHTQVGMEQTLARIDAYVTQK
jgi:Polyketide cyclase / dehydrase and lipid transport